MKVPSTDWHFSSCPQKDAQHWKLQQTQTAMKLVHAHRLLRAVMAWRLVALVVFTEAQQVPATCTHVKRDKWTKKVCTSSRDLRLYRMWTCYFLGVGSWRFVYSFKFQVHQGWADSPAAGAVCLSSAKSTSCQCSRDKRCSPLSGLKSCGMYQHCEGKIVCRVDLYFRLAVASGRCNVFKNLSFIGANFRHFTDIHHPII